jgi:Bacterial Ig-like domain (group 3)
VQTVLGGGFDGFVVKIAPGARSTTAVTSPVNPSVFGQQVTFTATVAPSAPNANTPTGTVVFEDGGTPVWIASLTNGTATFTTSGLSVGTHTIKVSYGRDSNSSASASATLTETVNQAAITTTVTGSPNPAWSSSHLHRQRYRRGPWAGGPTSRVTFLDGTATLGTGDVSSGVATFNTSTLSLGSHTITAHYLGDATSAASVSAGFTQTVTLPPVSIFVPESIKVTDTPALLLPVSIFVPESIKVTDTPTLLLPVSIFVPESIKVTDTPAITPQGPVNVFGHVSVTSQVSYTAASPERLTEP